MYVFITEILWRTFWSNIWRSVFWRCKNTALMILWINKNIVPTFLTGRFIKIDKIWIDKIWFVLKNTMKNCAFLEMKMFVILFFEKFLLPFVQPGQTQDLRSYVRTIFCTCRIPIVTKVVIKLVNLLFNEYWNTTESWEIIIFMLIDRWPEIYFSSGL